MTRRFRQFPRDPRSGGGIVLATALAVFLAAGSPGIASGGTAAGNWLDLTTRTRVQLDSEVVVITGDAGEDAELVQEILSAKGPVRSGGAASGPLRAIDFRAMAYRAAKGAGIRHPTLFVRQMAAESGMRPCAVSGAGAIGIAQIMPATARGWGVDPWVPADALRAAAKNMAKYERQLGSYSLALAAYNAGPGAVQRFGGVPPYAETRGYIGRITNRSAKLPGMAQTFTIPGRLTPTFARRLRALTADVRKHGGTLRVAEGWRSYEDSTRIWKAAVKKTGSWERAIRFAAPPGCSNHVRGEAATLTGSTGMARRLAAKHGLLFPYSYQPGYVEQSGLRTQSGDLR
ncbi:MAG: transglycosylase domain protein [Thermoleophilia bacterium]|nr:transglycosylase domain protein [Thermoleophilia bacterium]